MTAPTPPGARHTAPPTTYADHGSPTDGWAVEERASDPTDPAVTGRIPAPVATAAPAASVRRTVTMRVAAIVAVVAFLVGVGVSLLLGPIMGPGGPGGPDGQGGPPGASASQTQSGTGT